MTFPEPATVPPIVLLDEPSMEMPVVLPRLAAPVALVPIQFPCSTLLEPPFVSRMPRPLDETTLPAPGTVPPNVLFEPPATITPKEAFVRRDEASALMPMKFP